MKHLLLAILIIFLSPYIFLITPKTYAQESEVAQVLNNIEDERNKKLEEQLGLTLPFETDNPNHIITFKDPSGKGIKLEIDGQGFKTVKSPYTLPSLGIGSHILTFRFTDKEETSQTLEKDLVVVPRPPVISAPENITKSEITIKGTALAGSTVEIFLAGDTLNFKTDAQVGADGTWSHKFTEEFKYTVYTLIARTKKNGFSSNLSEPVVFEISLGDSGQITTKTPQPIYFNFTDINANNALSVLKNNPHLVLLAALSAILGGLLTWILEGASSRKINKTAEGKFIKLLSEKDTEKKGKKVDTKQIKTDKKMTLKEKFEKAGFKLPQEHISKTDSIDKSISKEEFMEEFKKEDPDDSRGNETKGSSKDRKKVSVSLTSKKS
ncbi:hypothetical protein IT417_01485 [bacterium]|nr:hypothetical protein [bacterium]